MFSNLSVTDIRKIKSVKHINNFTKENLNTEKIGYFLLKALNTIPYVTAYPTLYIVSGSTDDPAIVSAVGPNDGTITKIIHPEILGEKYPAIIKLVNNIKDNISCIRVLN
tara:strand:- start:1788 stop:2117 length:330 start_codon:yes stop_codon:yes gene_type:complete